MPKPDDDFDLEPVHSHDPPPAEQLFILWRAHQWAKLKRAERWDLIKRCGWFISAGGSLAALASMFMNWRR